MSQELLLYVTPDITFELKELVKTQMTYEQLAKKLKCSRQKVGRILNCPEEWSYTMISKILALLGYELQLNCVKAH